MTEKKSLVPIYNSKGDPEAFLVYPYLYNRSGDWIGWITPNKEIYSVIGHYVGYLAEGPRILRKRSISTIPTRKHPPAKPPKVHPPAHLPLAPLMPELSHSEIDILLDEPERLHTIDSGELRDDLN